MKAPTRQAEVNPEIVKKIGGTYGRTLTVKRYAGESLEGTGSLVFDQEHRKVYCSLSERACEKTLQNFIKTLNSMCKQHYRLVTFHSFDN